MYYKYVLYIKNSYQILVLGFLGTLIITCNLKVCFIDTGSISNTRLKRVLIKWETKVPNFGLTFL